MNIRKRVGKRGTVYLLDYWLNGRRKVESLGKITKYEAELIRAQRLKDIAEGKYTTIKDYKKIMFFDMCQEFLNWSKVHKKSYKRDYQLVNNLKSYFANIPLYRITRKRAEDYQAWRIGQKLKSGKLISKATCNREIACLKKIWNKTIDWGNATNNPISKIEMFREEQTKRRFFSLSELEKLIDTAPENLKSIIKVAYETGMGEGELLTLTWKNINFDLNRIYIEHTKSGKVREIPMGDVVREIFWNFKKVSNSEYIFVNQKGEPYKKIRLDKILKRVGIENASTHTLRHTCASHLIMDGVNLKVVQEYLGHIDINTTLRYAHLAPGAKEAAVRILDTELKAITSGNKTVILSDKSKTKKSIPSKVPEK